MSMNGEHVSRSFGPKARRRSSFLYAIAAILGLASPFMAPFITPALADTTWTGGSVSVADPINGGTWSNGIPNTAANPGFINDGSTITVTGDFTPGNSDGNVVDLTLSGTSKIQVNGSFVPLSGIGGSKKGKFAFTLTDSSEISTTGNFWGGTNDGASTVAPIDGEDYVLYQTYSGNSRFTSAEWWAGMSVKTHILIEDNAFVNPLSGNSGIGWGTNSAGTMMEMTGGTLQCDSAGFQIASSGSATADFSGGTATFKNLQIGTASGAEGTMIVSGDANITVTGSFTPVTFDSGTSCVKMSLDDNASVTVNGNFWGGSNLGGSTVAPIAGEDYVLYQTYSGNSQFTCGEWWTGMSVKTHILIEDNAIVNPLSGNSGIGWSGNSAGTVLEMTGGKINNANANTSFTIGESKDATMNMSGGAGDFNTLKIGTATTGTLNMSGNAVITTNALNMGAGDGSVSTLDMSGDAKLSVAGALIPVTIGSGTSCVKMSLDDNAELTVTGNFWGGTNNGASTVAPIAGEEYVLYQTYSGNSKFTSAEWWAGMSVKTHILIENNAFVNPKSGNSGIGWGTNSAGTVLEMTGGTLQCDSTNFQISSNGSATADFSGGTATFQNLQIGTISGVEGTMIVSGDANITTAVSLEIGQNGPAYYIQSGGSVTNNGTVGYIAHGGVTTTMDISGGSLTFNNATTYMADNDAAIVNLNLSGTGTMTTKNLRAGQHGQVFIDMTDNSVLNTGVLNLAYDYDKSDNAVTTLTMSGNSRINSSGAIVSFQGFNDNNHDGKGCVTISLSDNASIIATGNFWGGSDDNANFVTPLDGSFAQYITMTDNSRIEAAEIKAGMSAKVYISISDNAVMLSKSGTAGIGWCANSSGSVLEMDGGTLDVVNWQLNGDMYVGKDSVVNISNQFWLGYSGATASNYTQTGGTFTGIGNVGKYIACTNTGLTTFNQSGGVFNATNGTLYITDTPAATADINLSGNAFFVANQVNMSQHGTTMLDITDFARLKTGNFYPTYEYAASDNAESEITMSGASTLYVSGNMVSFQGVNNNNHSGPGQFSMTLTDNANVYITGNYWGGSNDHDFAVTAKDGQYAQYLTFGGNSRFSTNEWWVAMTAKTKIAIQDNATVTARGGNAGLGWDNDSAGSVIDLTGGTLNVFTSPGDTYSFRIGSEGSAIMNQSGGRSNVTFMTITQSGSQFNLSGGTANIGKATVNTNATMNLTGGTMNIGYLENNGTTTLDGSTINLGEYGYVNSLNGTFNATSGVIQANALDGMAHTAGDQMIIGAFSNEAAANAFASLAAVPAGWTKSVVNTGTGMYAAIGTFGDTPNDTIKICTDGGVWQGNTANSTGLVMGGTNTFSSTSGKVFVTAGTNTFSADIGSGNLLVINGGTNNFDTGNISGNLVINGGAFSTIGARDNYLKSSGSLTINGGTFTNDSNWFKLENDMTINNGIVTIGGNGIPILGNGNQLTLNGGRLTMPRIIIGDTQGNSGSRNLSTYEQNGGFSTFTGNVEVGQKSFTDGYLYVNDGFLTSTADIIIAKSADSNGLMQVAGGEVTAKRIIVGRNGAGSSAVLNVTGGRLLFTQDLCGSGAASGNVFVSGTGQMIFDSNFASYPTIRELSYFGIEGTGPDGTGALRFMQSASVGTSPVTLTGDALIRLETNTVGSNLTMNVPFNSESEEYTLDIAGSGQLIMTSVEPGTLKNMTLSGTSALFSEAGNFGGTIYGDADSEIEFVSTSAAVQDYSGAINTAGSVTITTGGRSFAGNISLDGGVFTVESGTTMGVGSAADTERQTIAVTGSGEFNLNGTLELTAYTKDKATGIDQIDFSDFAGNVTFGEDFSLIVNLDNPDDFAASAVYLDWTKGLDTSILDVSDLIISDGRFIYKDFLEDGTLFFADRDAVPEPSTWIMMILGVFGLAWLRRNRKRPM